LAYAHKFGKKDELGIENLKKAWHQVYRYIHFGEEFNEQDFQRTWDRIDVDFNFETLANQVKSSNDRRMAANGISNDQTLEDLIDGHQRGYAKLLEISILPPYDESSNALFWMTYECRKVFYFSRAIAASMLRFTNRNTITQEIKFIPDDISGFRNPSDEEVEKIIAGLKLLGTKIKMGSQLTDEDKETWRKAMCFWRKVNSIDDETFKEKWKEIVRLSDPADFYTNDCLFDVMHEVQECRKLSVTKIQKLNVEEIAMTFSLIELFIKNPISEVDRIENDYFYSKLMG